MLMPTKLGYSPRSAKFVSNSHKVVVLILVVIVFDKQNKELHWGRT